jgi:hypothetical protein
MNAFLVDIFADFIFELVVYCILEPRRMYRGFRKAFRIEEMSRGVMGNALFHGLSVGNGACVSE